MPKTQIKDFLLIVGLSISISIGFADLASAAVKSGASCNKKSATQIVGNKKFTCTLKGKKLVWDSGVSLPANNSVTRDTFVQKSPFPNSTKELLNTVSVENQLAWSKSMNEIKSNANRQIMINTVVGENTKPDILNSEYSKYLPDYYINQVYQMFSSVKNMSSPTLIYASFKDREWADSKLKQYCGNNCGVTFSQYCDFTNLVCGGGFFATSENQDNNVILIAASTTPWRVYTENIGTIESHEFTHAVQHAYFSKVSQSYFQEIPRWFSEGEANLNEMLLGGGSNNVSPYNTTVVKVVAPQNTYEEFLVNRNAEIAMLKNNPNSEDYLLDFLNASVGDYYDSGKYSQRQVYYYGALLVEALRAIKGPNAEVVVFKEVATGKTFSQAFQVAYGENWDSAKVNLAKYLAKQLN